MLLVETYVGDSSIHGRGLFASKDIAPGTIIWQAGFELLYTPETFAALSDFEKRFILIWGWQDKLDGLHHLSLDNDRFINHSDTPNTKVEPDGLTVARRQIKRGEEILCNYREFEMEFRFDKL